MKNSFLKQLKPLTNGEATNDALMEAGSKLSEIVAQLEMKTERWMELAEFA